MKKKKQNEDHSIPFYHFMANRWGKNGNSDRLSWAPKSRQMVTAAMKLKDTCSLEENYDQPDSVSKGSISKSRDITLPTKVV